MTAFLLILLAFLSLSIFIWGARRRERMIQYPFLAAVVFLGWMFPQLLGLTNNPWLIPAALDKTIFMAILCLAATWAGYNANHRPATMLNWNYDYDRLLRGAIVMMMVGGFFFYQVTLLASEAGTSWTGIITIYVFFSSLLTFGFALALILFLNRATWPSLFAVFCGLIFYFDRIVIHGRRAAMAEFGFMILLALWFNRRWTPSRLVMVTALVIGALVVNSIGDYRRTMLGESYMTGSYGYVGAGLDDILNIDFFGNLRDIAKGDSGNFELTNAAMDIEAADQTLQFDYGLSLWNAFVNNYVPAQWVGKEFKQAITVRLGADTRRILGHNPHTGSTLTGLSDAFKSFWYFGAIKFFIIALILNRWYRAAIQGNIAGQLVVMLTIGAALHAITHSTHHFFTVFLQLTVFLLPVLALARRREKNQEWHMGVTSKPITSRTL